MTPTGPPSLEDEHHLCDPPGHAGIRRDIGGAGSDAAGCGLRCVGLL